MTQAAAVEPGAHAHGAQQVHRTLLEDAGAHAIDHVVARAVFQDDRVDPVEMQQVPEQESGGAGADDSHLGLVNYREARGILRTISGGLYFASRPPVSPSI